MAPGETERIVPPMPSAEEHASRLARVPVNGVGIFVCGHEEKPIIVPGAHSPRQLIFGRRAGDGPPPAFDLLEYGGLDGGVSRQHGVLIYSRETFYYQDLGSTNGSWRNGSRLFPYRSYEISSGDRLSLGDLDLFIYFHSVKPVLRTHTVILEPKQIPGLDHEPKITPAYLLKVVVPYLAALAELQSSLNEIMQTQPYQVVVNRITDSPLSITLTGGTQALEVIKSRIQPWQNKHLEEIGEVLKRQMDLASPNAPRQTGWFGISLRARSGRDDSLDPVTQRSLERLAEVAVAYVRPGLSDSERQAYAAALMTYVRILALAPLELFEAREAPGAASGEQQTPPAVKGSH